jgi:hypothetical protein
MENNQVLVEELSVIERIKAERDEYLAEYVKVRKANMGACGLGMLKDFKCKDCEAEFNAIPTDAKYCPSCLSSDLRIIQRGEERISDRIYQKIDDEIKAEIRELRSQNLSKKDIADKLCISIDSVSDVVGLKKRKLPQEKIDYIRNAHLAGRSDWEIRQELGRISEERVGEVVGDLCSEIKEAYLKGIRPENMGEIFGLQGSNQVIIDHVNGFIKWGILPKEPGLPPLTNEEMGRQIEKNMFGIESST